jgi:hypothetical protein
MEPVKASSLPRRRVEKPMRIASLILVALAGAALLGGCPGNEATSIGNPFATLTDIGLVQVNVDNDDTEVPSVGAIEGEDVSRTFRQPMTVTFQNFNTQRELLSNFLAWVEPGSVTTEAQRDALVSSGYVLVEDSIDIGSAFTLVRGTYLYQGTAGANLERIELGEFGATGGIPSERSLTLVTPDVILLALEPPVSCDSVAFRFVDQGDVITETRGDSQADAGAVPDGGILWANATNVGVNKTLAQVDAYQCSPFRPGLFLRVGGGARDVNEFVEGDEVIFEFYRFPVSAGGETLDFDVNGVAARVVFPGDVTGGAVGDDPGADGSN